MSNDKNLTIYKINDEGNMSIILDKGPSEDADNIIEIIDSYQYPYYMVDKTESNSTIRYFLTEGNYQVNNLIDNLKDYN